MNHPSVDLAQALAGRYAIERELGQGGMATVYLASDLRHDRRVALKVLRPEFARTLGSARFLREVRLAARLSHPHILPLFDSGEADGLLYYVMPVVEGASVRERLDREQPLPLDEAVHIAAEVALALDYAHRQGIVHRDIKPENILLHEGHALVADFGIGKALTEAGANDTGAGLSVGTPTYMSPEQAAGDAVDGRSDLYSLGCVLYEMLAGEPPFHGPSVQAVIAKRFVQVPADLTALREGVPRPVARAVQKALARAPIDRHATGAEFVAALREVEAVLAAPPPEKSLAVLPFTNLSADPENEYFADGVTEEILNALAAVPDLRVAGRTSSFSFKGKRQELRAIGELLNVRTVLEGSVRRAGGRVRITAQLVDAADGFRLWSERYDREIGDVFAVQDEIATAIAARLEATLHAGRAAALEQRTTDSIQAYEAYLKGRALFYRRGTGIREGLAQMQRALDLDPNYALAWAGRADGFSLLGYYGALPPEICAPAARESAARALELGPNLAEAHNAKAVVSMLFDWDWPRAELAFRQALELDPNYLQAAAWYGFFLGLVCGRWDEAIEVVLAAQRKEPLSAYAAASLAFCLGYGGRVADGVHAAERAVALDGTSFLSLWSLQNMLYLDRQFARSVEVGEQVLLMSGRHPWGLLNIAVGCVEGGDLAGARAIHAELTARAARGFISPFHRGIVAAMVGEGAIATALLQEAIARHDPAIPFFLDWFADHPGLRDLPATAEVVAAAKLADDGRRKRWEARRGPGESVIPRSPAGFGRVNTA